MKPVGQRFLMIYAGVLTAVFAVTVLSGFVASPRSMKLDQLDVQRINLREPDGTLRLVISNAAEEPGILIKGKEYPHPNRKAAGMLFYNDEGTENGGLMFGGEKSKDGSKRSYGHLSFDAYEQDQALAMDAEQNGAQRETSIRFNDYPDYSLLDEIQLMESAKNLPKDQQQAKLKAFLDEHGRATTRMRLSRNDDNSVALALSDAQGHPRIQMMVAPDGTPSIQLLDASGKVMSELVPKH
ncbi:hypothetical protein [Dyella mobilis]|uniref:Uncharacterized protein n=1 Tax=Dyella mobilis TaxID=1849582 RepID=A0ABS2KK20_9GAMM|nr:hypothetical protein [Dyella mobilis]MBM7131486.1 hypothetical protein [Dyella mobilis]GLQ96541.1 hypothetical protein GCM10007863_09590 [Dyella mobilis]